MTQQTSENVVDRRVTVQTLTTKITQKHTNEKHTATVSQQLSAFNAAKINISYT